MTHSRSLLALAAILALATLPLLGDRQEVRLAGATVELNKPFKNSLGMELVPIPVGKFTMGSPKNEVDRAGDEDEHEVEITQPFWLGKTEVTRGQFRKFVEADGYQTEGEKDGKGAIGFNPESGNFEQKPEYTWKKAGFAQTDEHPVVNVSWNDARAFCTWLSQKEGKKYVLPTEAQWEYCCRAKTTTRFHSGDDQKTVASVGNIADASAKKQFPTWTCIPAADGYVFTAPVGRFQANAFGLHDMHGNVWELCNDWYGEKYYQDSPRRDPPGPGAGAGRVVRGGSWSLGPRLARSAFRLWRAPVRCYDDVGFRVVVLR